MTAVAGAGISIVVCRSSCWSRGGQDDGCAINTDHHPLPSPRTHIHIQVVYSRASGRKLFSDSSTYWIYPAPVILCPHHATAESLSILYSSYNRPMYNGLLDFALSTSHLQIPSKRNFFDNLFSGFWYVYRCMRREAYRPIVSLLRSPEAHYTRRVVISAKEVMRSRQFVYVCVCVCSGRYPIFRNYWEWWEWS